MKRIDLPAGTMYQPDAATMSTEELATRFINYKMATGLTTEALKAALDGRTLWKGLRAEYDVYAEAQNAITIRPDDVAELMGKAQWEALDPATRKDLRNRINKKAAYNRQGLAAVRRFIDVQAGGDQDGSEAFRRVYEERLTQYLNEPIS